MNSKPVVATLAVLLLTFFNDASSTPTIDQTGNLIANGHFEANPFAMGVDLELTSRVDRK